MKKSLLVTLYFPPIKGGISKSLWNVCDSLGAKNIVVLTETSNISPETKYKIFRTKMISSFRFVWPKWLLLLKKVRKIIRNENIKIIQAGQILPIGLICLIIKKIYKTPYLVYVYGQDLVIMRNSWRKMKIIKLILKNANYIIANSEYTRNKAIELGSNLNNTIVVQPVPLSIIEKKIDQQSFNNFKNEHNLNDKKIILTVGNIVKRKGQDMVVRSLPYILKMIPNAKYLIVGKGPYKDEICKIIEKLGMQKKVEFFENVTNEQLPYFYRTADVFAMPARELMNKNGETVDVEGFGMVFLEANLYGKPVIGGNSGGISEVIKHGYTGYIVEPEKEKEIAKYIIQLLTNPEMCKKMGEQGRDRVIKEYRWQNEMEKIKNILQ